MVGCDSAATIMLSSVRTFIHAWEMDLPTLPMFYSHAMREVTKSLRMACLLLDVESVEELSALRAQLLVTGEKLGLSDAPHS